MGRAVDVTAERRRTYYRIEALPKDTAEVAYQITLRNAKSQDVTVDVVERMMASGKFYSSRCLTRRTPTGKRSGRS